MTACKAMALTGAVAALGLTACGGSGRSAGAGRSAGTSKAPASKSSSTSTTSAPSTPRSRAPASSREVATGVVQASAGGVTARMRLSGHHPRVNAAWPVRFTVKRRGRPVKAEVRYQYLFAGQVVARRSHYRFYGSFHDVFRWPASAVGYPLSFRAVVTAAGVTLNLDYPVQVQG
jgi:hypothetical protein